MQLNCDLEKQVRREIESVQELLGLLEEHLERAETAREMLGGALPALRWILVDGEAPPSLKMASLIHQTGADVPEITDFVYRKLAEAEAAM